jgi:hypothetical protein
MNKSEAEVIIEGIVKEAHNDVRFGMDSIERGKKVNEIAEKSNEGLAAMLTLEALMPVYEVAKFIDKCYLRYYPDLYKIVDGKLEMMSPDDHCIISETSELIFG